MGLLISARSIDGVAIKEGGSLYTTQISTLAQILSVILYLILFSLISTKAFGADENRIKPFNIALKQYILLIYNDSRKFVQYWLAPENELQ